jgi:hypothetical protein
MCPWCLLHFAAAAAANAVAAFEGRANNLLAQADA